MHVDTASDWAGSPFTGRIITPYHVQKRAYRMKEYNWSFVDVQTEGNYDVRVNQAIMRRGLPAAAGDNVTALSVLGAESGWGEGEWAEAVWGGTTYAGERIRPPTVSRAPDGSGSTPKLSNICSSPTASQLNPRGPYGHTNQDGDD